MPSMSDSEWRIVHPWDVNAQGYLSFEAEASGVLGRCKANPEQSIVFPTVIHGYHELRVGGVLVKTLGDPHFGHARSIFAAPILTCRELLAFAPTRDASLHWKVSSFSRYFARIPHFPIWVQSTNWIAFISEGMYVLTAGLLLAMAGLFWILFSGKIEPQLQHSITFASLSFTVYLISSVPGLLGLDVSHLFAHRVGDIGLFVGKVFLFRAFQLSGILSLREFRFYLLFIFGIVAFLLLAQDGDVANLATFIAIFPTLALISISLVRLLSRSVKHGWDSRTFFQLLSLMIVLSASLSDSLVFLGISHRMMLLPIGLLAGIFFLLCSIHREVENAYQERDFLRIHLEQEVQRQTEEILQKKAQLQAMERAKLEREAAFGEMAVQVAHDIRSPIAALQMIFESLIDVQKEKKDLFQSAVSRIQDIARLLLEKNRAQISEIANAHEMIDEILTEKRISSPGSSIDFILTTQSHPSDTRVRINAADLKRVISNLIDNAIQAIEKQGKIEVLIQLHPNQLEIRISDPGKGIPSEQIPLLGKKGVTFGKPNGSGLGLYHAIQCIKGAGGSLNIHSKFGIGTEITILLPRMLEE